MKKDEEKFKDILRHCDFCFPDNHLDRLFSDVA
jgi:hypothetical protein